MSAPAPGLRCLPIRPHRRLVTPPAASGDEHRTSAGGPAVVRGVVLPADGDPPYPVALPIATVWPALISVLGGDPQIHGSVAITVPGPAPIAIHHLSDPGAPDLGGPVATLPRNATAELVLFLFARDEHRHARTGAAVPPLHDDPVHGDVVLLGYDPDGDPDGDPGGNPTDIDTTFSPVWHTAAWLLHTAVADCHHVAGHYVAGHRPAR